MGRTIEQLWNGRIAPWERCGAGNPEIEELVILIERHERALDTLLSSEQTAIFEKYADCMDEYIYLLSVEAFRSGFRLAKNLLTEALS